MFGIHEKSLLWVRTFFQFFLYFWALSLQTKGWVIRQVWKDVLFIHYSVPADKIQNLVPFELDLYDNKAVISVVPFYMDGIRFPFLPSIPKLSNLWELNIRTYVNVNGIKGIYFFTLETDSKIGELIAKFFFHLPYRFSSITAKVIKNEYFFAHSRDDLSFNCKVIISKETELKNNFSTWATERYSLFTYKDGTSYQGVVEHPPWNLAKINLTSLENHFTKMITPEVEKIIGIHYSKEIKVQFQNFKKIQIQK